LCDTFHHAANEKAESSLDRVVILAHCIVNQSTRARWQGGGATRTEGTITDVITPLIEHGIGIIQMECPEQTLYGNPRHPRSRDDYEIPVFKDKCREIAVRTTQAIENSASKLIAVLGFEGSPSCGVERTTRTIEGSHAESPGEGHLIEAIRQEMREKGLDAPIIGVGLREGEMRVALGKVGTLLKD
jgi:predicted secreted protein